MPVPLKLKVFKGDELVATRDFERDMIKIGRLSTAHLCLDDERASRIHSVLNVEGDGRVSVVDMGSIEGTFLNGRRVNKGFVQFGDELRIGSTRIIVERGGGEANVVANRVVEAPADTADAAPNAAANAVEPAAATPPPPPPEAADEEPAAATAEPATTPVFEEEPASGRERELHLHEKPFGSYQAQAPVARRQKLGARSGLQIRFYWGDQLLQVSQLAEPGALYVGASPRCAFHIGGDRAQDHALIEAAGEGFAVNVGAGMRAQLERDGARKPLASGTHELRPGDFAVVEMGGVRAELEFSPQARRVAVSLSKSIDYRFVNLFLLLAFCVGLFMVAASTRTDADVVADDLNNHRLVVAKFLIKEAERPKHNALLDKLAQIKDPHPGEMAEKHSGDEGKMGKKDAPFNKNNRSAPKAIDINAKDLVKNSGLLKTLGSGGGGLSTIFGQGGLGGDIKGALGNMFGSQVGDSGGFGGLGLKGTGSGGGGTGHTIGIGAVGTKGRGGGLASYGVGVGSLDPKKTVDPTIADSETQVQGSLDKELIRQVIRRNIGQIRYCYESELQVKPGLAGRVSIQFVINASGDVQSARVAEGTTLHDPRVTECIAVRVRSWKFPSPKGGGSVVVTYPFVFKQSGE